MVPCGSCAIKYGWISRTWQFTVRKFHCTLHSHMDALAGKLAAGGCAEPAGGMLARVILMMHLEI